MAKIQLIDMSFYYEDYYHLVFQKVNLILDTDWCLGLIGRNGRGKTTLLRLLKGELEPGEGKILAEKTMELFPYKQMVTYQNTLEVVKENIGGLTTMEKRMERLLEENAAKSLAEYELVLEEYLDKDGYNIESMIRKEMGRMGLSEELLEQEYDTLSGGEKTRLQIIALFLKKNTFVLLDEPTEHLDMEGKRLLTEYLKKKRGFIVVSHDREFLNQVTDHILAINKATIELEKGNYATWKENMERKENFERKVEEKLRREIQQLERTSEKQEAWAEVGNTQKYKFAGNARANGTKRYLHQAKLAQEKILEDLERKKLLLRNMEVEHELSLLQEEGCEEELVRVEELAFSYGRRRIFGGVTFELRPGDRLWLRGRNGSGKSTLLRLIKESVSQEKVGDDEGVLAGVKDGRIWTLENLHIAVVEQEPLWKRGVLRELVTDKVQYAKLVGICESFDLIGEILERPLESFSSGELHKLDMARGLAEKSQLLLLDEPLNYMDVMFRSQLEKAILKYKPTMIFVEHEEGFGERVATKRYMLDRF